LAEEHSWIELDQSPDQSDLDEYQRFIRSADVKKAKQRRSSQGAGGVIPSPDFVHRFVRDELFQNSAGVFQLMRSIRRKPRLNQDCKRWTTSPSTRRVRDGRQACAEILAHRDNGRRAVRSHVSTDETTPDAEIPPPLREPPACSRWVPLIGGDSLIENCGIRHEFRQQTFEEPELAAL